MSGGVFFLIVFLLGVVRTQTVNECHIGDNVLLPPSSNHSYFLRCRDYYTSTNGDPEATTTACLEVKIPDLFNTTTISMSQNCGDTWNTFLLIQEQIESKECQSGFETKFNISFNGGLVAQDEGCWSVLRGNAYQLGGKFICGTGRNGPSDHCAQWISLDSTNDSKRTAFCIFPAICVIACIYFIFFLF